MSNINNIAKCWYHLGAAITNKEQCPAAFDRVYIGRLNEREGRPVHIRKPVKKDDRRLQNYFVFNEPLLGIYLTRREAQVLYLICHGATNKQVADKMGLSSRTTEYYIKNMRQKTATSSKQNLIYRVVETDFLKRIDVEVLFSES